MSVDKMTVDETTADKTMSYMVVDKMTVDRMIVDEMSIDKWRTARHITKNAEQMFLQILDFEAKKNSKIIHLG